MSTYQIFNKIFKGRYHLLLLSVLVLTSAGIFEALSVVGIIPLIDIIIHKDLQQVSPITTKIIDCFQYLEIPVSVINISVILFLLVLSKSCISFLGSYINLKLQFTIAKTLIVEIFDSFIEARWQFFVTKKYGTLGNSLLNEWQRMHSVFEQGGRLLDTVLRCIFYSTVILLISWELTITVLFITILLIIPFWKLGKITYRYGLKQTKAANEYYSFVLETFNALKIILGYGNNRKSFSIFKNRVENYIKYPFRLMLLQRGSALLLEPIVILSLCLAIYLGVYVYHIKISELLVIIYSLKMSSTMIKNGIDQRNDVLNNIPALKQLYEIEQQAEEMKQFSGTKKFVNIKKGIVFENIAFSYPNHQEVLNDISIDIPKGKMTAIVGISGTGKTTLSDILMGLYKVENGSILIDDVSLYQYDILTWRKKIGFVPQEPFLFNASIRNNILWSMETASENEVFEACKMANAMEFIEELPNKLDTIVGERGIRLSGGQRQRIALARAIVRKPEIMVLDEATSALDSHSEQLVQLSIEAIAQHTTIFVIAHRLATIQKADCIYYMDGGKITESGTFEELISITNGKFHDTAILQGMKGNSFVN